MAVAPDVRVFDAVPASPSYAYHIAPREVLYNIAAEGLRAQDPAHRAGPERVLELVAETFDIPYPINRRTATFCYPTPDAVDRMLSTASDDGLGHDGVVVVDTAALDTEMYLANHRYMSDLITQNLRIPNNSPEDIAAADPDDLRDCPVTQTARDYLTSFTPVTSMAEARAYARDHEVAELELIIDGDVPTDAMAGLYCPNMSDLTQLRPTPVIGDSGA